uniref:M12 family metallo-peptidase n=1 Tax=Cysteiniphilum litorale TaxID=2056700 RepID=UPI003F8850CD
GRENTYSSNVPKQNKRKKIMWFRLFVVSCLALTSLVDADNEFQSENSPATVRIHHERSTESELKASVDVFGKTYHLNLKASNLPAVPVYEITVDINGNVIIHDTPGDHNCTKLYEDEVTGALLYFNEDNMLEGLITDSIVLKYENNEHVGAKIVTKSPEPFCATKDSDPKLAHLTQESNKVHDDNKALVFYPEVLHVVDSKLYRILGSVRNLVLYSTMFWKTTDKRYRTVNSARIYLRLTAIYYSRSVRIDNYIMHVSGDRSNIYLSLRKFSYHMRRYQRYYKIHDVAYLTTARDLYYGSSNNYLGVAYVGAACYSSSRYAYNLGLGEDNGLYVGYMTAAHEIAHILGAPHDGNGVSASCSWKLGYMMSYVRNSTNTLKFSPCSSAAMIKTYYYRHASCLRRISSGAFRYPYGYPGLSSSFNKQCVQRTGKSNATDRKTVPHSNQCFRLICQYYTGSTLWQYDSFFPALEGTPCPSGGYCNNGSCQSSWAP